MLCGFWVSVSLWAWGFVEYGGASALVGVELTGLVSVE